jgi:hypothetical protein
MRPIELILLRGRLEAEVLLSGGNHCFTALVLAVSATVTAGHLSVCWRLHSVNHCIQR